MPTTVFALNVHASWACRHSGACCRAGWSIPVEPHARAIVAADWLHPDSRGICSQLDEASMLCRIHRDYGEHRLPESCFQFPRRALIDGRGTFVSLSNFCPTAASLLVDADGPLEIVASPPAFPGSRRYEGLDARGEWPPLLRPDVLFDAESFATWEAYVVSTLGSSTAGVECTISRIAAAAERVRGWSAARGSLLDWTRAATAVDDDGAAGLSRFERYQGADAYDQVRLAVPEGLARPDLPHEHAMLDSRYVAPHWNAHRGAVLRYLGARAFASWTVYQSRGIRTQVAELVMTATVLRAECIRACARENRPLDRAGLVEAIRASDLLLVHLADRHRLMAWLGKAEG